MDTILFHPPEPAGKYMTRKDYRISPVPHIYLSAQESKRTRPTIIHYHGNATDCHHMSDWAEQFTRSGWNVMLIEYPGYGPYRANGPDRAQIHRDIDILASELPRGYYHVIGQSIGTGPAASLAEKLTKRGMKIKLTLITPYSSIAELSGDYAMIPVLDILVQAGMWMFLPNDFPTLDNAMKLVQSGISVDVHHGTDDTIIPYHHAKRFGYNGCNLHTYPCSHNDILSYCTHLIMKLQNE